MKQIFLALLVNFFFTTASAQAINNKNLVYADSKGVLRYTSGRGEAAFFGVNYTTPFAYGYRAHKALGVDLQKAIDADVHHFARLGFDAFRVHVWDTEITDSLGNLKDNEHLRLFDYLLYKLKERNIKILITPLAFWGNGYPEKDEATGSFSSMYNKQKILITEAAIKAQERYLEQFFKHVNPYTKLKYEDDRDVIAMEINNEPHHTGPKTGAADYIRRMVAAVKGTGWSKPVFYNISESPAYADVVAQAPVDGVSFQWYPTGLVANRSLKGNYLPNVDHYKIPFGDTIAAYKNKVRMVYEFDAGDVFESYMYPAMARSFRTAGFQWATQFAYDPMATAYANTEYQTHYVNLAHTPSKAISLLIASKVFHKLPRLKTYGAFPADTLFDVFRVSYKQRLSEMNSDEEFYYSNTTTTVPKTVARLKHIAGVGSSPLVGYEGTGAYFLDKLSDGVWRLEVMPDAIHIRDPFEKASLKKEVTRIQWKWNKMQLSLPGLGSAFVISGIDKDNRYTATANEAGSFFIRPGVYTIVHEKKGNEKLSTVSTEFYAPPSSSAVPAVVHQPFGEVSANRSFLVSTRITGLDSTDKVTMELRNSANKWKTLQLQRKDGYDYSTEVPAELVTPGLINYRVMVQKDSSTYTFPGGFKGDPYAWDEYRNESWQVAVAPPGGAMEVFNAATDQGKLMLYNTNWRTNTTEYTTTDRPRELALKATIGEPTATSLMGWQTFIGDHLSGRMTEAGSFTKLVIKGRSGQAAKVQLSLITADADAYSASVQLNTEWSEIELPLSSLKKGPFLLLPRPYPGFLPLKYTSAGTRPLDIRGAEKLEITFGEDAKAGTPVSIEIESVYLKK
ncbi:MAG TPA: cellulase family glycosylhydrolase [Flavisolibacter sp.]